MSQNFAPGKHSCLIETPSRSPKLSSGRCACGKGYSVAVETWSKRTLLLDFFRKRFNKEQRALIWMNWNCTPREHAKNIDLHILPTLKCILVYCFHLIGLNCFLADLIRLIKWQKQLVRISSYWGWNSMMIIEEFPCTEAFGQLGKDKGNFPRVLFYKRS